MLGSSLNSVSAIIKSLKTGGATFWAAQAQALYMWKNLPNFAEKPQRFEKMGPLIYDSLCLLPEYLYALLDKLVLSRKHTMHKEGVIEDDGSLSHNSDDRTSMGSMKELQLDET